MGRVGGYGWCSTSHLAGLCYGQVRAESYPTTGISYLLTNARYVLLGACFIVIKGDGLALAERYTFCRVLFYFYSSTVCELNSDHQI